MMRVMVKETEMEDDFEVKVFDDEWRRLKEKRPEGYSALRHYRCIKVPGQCSITDHLMNDAAKFGELRRLGLERKTAEPIVNSSGIHRGLF
jgi:hypothetical protein